MWKAVYDSVIGTSHEEAGIPCQDACRVLSFASEDGGLFVACLADGAGSASHSHLGAEAVCDAFVRIVERDCRSAGLNQLANRETVLEWCNEIRSVVMEKAGQLEVEIRELASTFLGIVVSETNALFVQIGDGAIVTWDGEKYQTVFWPQSGEYANLTNFLTDEQFEEHVDWTFVDKPVDELAAFSDGLERLTLRFAEQEVHGPFFTPLFAALRRSNDPEEYFEPLRAFLNSPKVNERTDDDKTLILATRLNETDDDEEVR